ncbi:MAG: hypothetical protein ACE5JU_16900 [Candidatus Binatia bacterium]
MKAVSYAIRWELLSEDELDFLDRVGVERHSSGMEFVRIPSWDDFCLVFVYLIGLERQTTQEGNHVAFAIGDCINAGYELFGKSKVDDWFEEFFELRAMRDYILNMAGGTLIFLQQVEQQIKLCCAMIPLQGLNLTLEDFFSMDPQRRRQTLGHLARVLRENELFNSDFEKTLIDFVNRRNAFVHNLWVEDWRGRSEISGLPSKAEFERIHTFIAQLIKDARYVRNVFRGLQYELMPREIIEAQRDDERPGAFSSWAKYIPGFQEVLREKPDPEET